jgi:hypothetical protein
MRWKGSAAKSKPGHRVVVERVLRPGGVLRVPAGAGNGGEGMAAEQSSGQPWRAQTGIAGRGNRAGEGRR